MLFNEFLKHEQDTVLHPKKDNMSEKQMLQRLVYRVQTYTLILANPYINNFLWLGMHIYQISQEVKHSYTCYSSLSPLKCQRHVNELMKNFDFSADQTY